MTGHNSTTAITTYNEELLMKTRLGTFGGNNYCGPTSVAQLDARPTGDEEVAGSTPAGSEKFFHGD